MFFNDLPNEIIAKIFGYLPRGDWRNLIQVCTKWAEFVILPEINELYRSALQDENLALILLNYYESFYSKLSDSMLLTLGERYVSVAQKLINKFKLGNHELRQLGLRHEIIAKTIIRNKELREKLNKEDLSNLAKKYEFYAKYLIKEKNLISSMEGYERSLAQHPHLVLEILNSKHYNPFDKSKELINLAASNNKMADIVFNKKKFYKDISDSDLGELCKDSEYCAEIILNRENLYQKFDKRDLQKLIKYSEILAKLVWSQESLAETLDNESYGIRDNASYYQAYLQ